MFGMLNAAGINYYIINRDNRARRGMAIINRQWFLLRLGKALITPWAQQRLSSPFLPRQLKTLITTVCGAPSLGDARLPSTSLTDSNAPVVRCCECTRKSDRKTRYPCSKSAKPKCTRHLYPICGDCFWTYVMLRAQNLFVLCCWCTTCLRVCTNEWLPAFGKFGEMPE